jgi:sugar phosphate isomerase/epimerase
MKFGLCAPLESLETVKTLGFDYIECSLSSIAAYTDEEYGQMLSLVKNSGFRVERFNVMFPKSIALIGPAFDARVMENYLESAFSRMSALGGTLAVFGSGACRKFPPGCLFKNAYRELVAVTKRIGSIAAGHHIEVAIEPLNTEETNCINSLKEGAMLQADAAAANVSLLADLYHMLREREDLGNLSLAGEFSHIHVALLEGRAYPVKKTRELEEFFRVLGDIGYTGTVSIEGKTGDMEQEGAQALGVLRSLVN